MSAIPDQIGTFTAPEIEAACALPPRTLELLKREKLTTGQVTPAGRGRQARFSFRALARTALVRALYLSVQSDGGHVVAARLAQGIGGELESIYGSVPFGFEDIQRAVGQKLGGADSIRAPGGEICRYRAIVTAWRNGLLDGSAPAANDYLLVIVDGELVGATNWRGLRFLMQNPANDGTIQPILKYRYAGRSGGLEIERMDSRSAEDYFYERMRAATAVVQLNLSLAVRRAAVAVARMRESADGDA